MVPSRHKPPNRASDEERAAAQAILQDHRLLEAERARLKAAKEKEKKEEAAAKEKEEEEVAKEKKEVEEEAGKAKVEEEGEKAKVEEEGEAKETEDEGEKEDVVDRRNWILGSDGVWEIEQKEEISAAGGEIGKISAAGAAAGGKAQAKEEEPSKVLLAFSSRATYLFA